MTVSDTPVKAIAPAFSVGIDAALLKAAVAKIKPAIDSKSYLKALACVRFDADGTDITLTATDLDTTLTTVVTGSVPDAGSLLVPFDLINKVISVRPKGHIEVGANGEEGFVRNGNAQVSFEPTPLDEYPRSPVVEGRAVTLNLDVLPELLPAVSKDDSRPILCSVLVEGGRYVSTDSYRLHLVDTGTDTGESFLLPRDAVKVMAKYTGPVNCQVDDDRIVVVLDESTTLTSRLVKGEFPPYQRLIPKSQEHAITFTDGFVNDLKVLVKLDNSATVLIDQHDSDTLELRTHGSATDRKTTVTTAGRSSLGCRVGFTPEYLIGILAGTTVNELRLIDSLKPALVVEAAPEYGANAERQRLIMPVRVN